MALTKIPRGLLDTGIADSSDATAITIDSSENATFAGDVLVNKHLRLRTTDDQTNQWYLYTHTDDTLRINYNGAGNDEIVIDTSGDVAVGSVTTLLRLQSVNSGTGSLPTDGTVGITAANANIPFGVHNESNSATYSGIAFETRTSGASRWLIANEWKSQYLGDLVFSRRTGGTSSAEAMRIDSSGNVSIGDSTADRLFHVKRSDSGGTVAKFENSAGTVYIELNTANQAGGDAGYLSYDSNKKLGLWTDDTQQVTVDANGKVGIGITTPGGLPLQTKVSSGDNKLRMTTASKDAFILELKEATGDVHLGTNTTAGAIVIKDNGKIGFGTEAPYSLFDIVTTSTAAYTTSSFNAASHIGLKMTDGVGRYAGIRFTNVNGNIEGFVGYEQTHSSGTNTQKADFVVQGYNRAAAAYQEKFRINDAGNVLTPKNPVFMCTGTGGWTAISGVNIINTSVFSVDYDRGGNFTASNGRFTAPVTGFYLFVFHTYTRANNTGGYVYPNFYVNGSVYADGSNTMIQHYQGHGDEDKGTCNTAHIYLTANQYVQVGHSAHGNSNPISYHGASLGFSGHLIG